MSASGYTLSDESKGGHCVWILCEGSEEQLKAARKAVSAVMVAAGLARMFDIVVDEGEFW